MLPAGGTSLRRRLRHRESSQTLVLERLWSGQRNTAKTLATGGVYCDDGRAAGAQTGGQGEIPHLHHGKRLMMIPANRHAVNRSETMDKAG